MQINRCAAETDLRRARCIALGHQIAVAEHDAFRAAGGAAGIEDAGEVASPACAWRRARCASHDQLPRSSMSTPAGRPLVGIDQLQAAGSVRASAAADRGKRLVDEQDIEARQSRIASSFSSGLQRILSGTITAPAQAVAR